MATIFKYGILLGVLVEIWTVVIIATGWYKDPALLMLFFLVIPLEVVLLVIALQGTASGAEYGQQVMTGTLISVVGGVIILVGSFLITTVVFPHYFADLRAISATALAKSGKTPEQIAAALNASDALYNPWTNSIQGFIGTVGTGIFTSLVAAIFLRRKTPAAPAA